jgi:hypothetical protein
LNERSTITRRLTSAGICILVGESGSDKSALAKEVALTDYPRTIWLSARSLDHEVTADFERALGLRHPFIDILRMSPSRCLIVFDGVEGYTERALRLIARFTTELLTSGATHVHLLLSIQFHAADVKLRQLATLKLPACAPTGWPRRMPSRKSRRRASVQGSAGVMAARA